MGLATGTLAYGIATGMAVSLALASLMISGRRKHRDAIALAFGVYGVTSALTTISTVRLQTSTSVGEYTDLLKWFGFFSLLSLLSFVALIVAWSGAPRLLMRLFVGATACIAVLQLVLPEGLLAGEVESLREVRLLGESFVVHDGGSSPWRPVLDLYLVLTFALVATGLVRAFRRGPTARAAVLTACVGISVVVGMYDSLVDEGIASTPYLAPFGDLAIVMLAAAILALQVAASDRRQERHTVELETTIQERTAALLESNRRLENTITQQRAAARQLARLAGHFESVNSLVLADHDPSEVRASVRSVLADLGELVRASTIRLTLVAAGDAGLLAEPIRWSVHDRAADDAPEPSAVVPLVVGGRDVGELEVWTSTGGIDGEHLQYLELTSEHLAGFVERVDLAERIAAVAIGAERERIAQELHDSVTQKLYSASFLADAVPGQLADETGQAAHTVTRVREILLSSLAELRTLMFELHPTALEATPLPQLLEQLCDTFTASGRLQTELTSAEVPLLPISVRVGMYRIAQEALSNAARHSGSDTALVDLRDDDGVELAVTDFGRGFDDIGLENGRGLRSMRRRAETIGAELHVSSSPGRGTTVGVRWRPTQHSAPVAAPTPLEASGGPGR